VATPPPTELEVNLAQHPTPGAAVLFAPLPQPSLAEEAGRLAGAHPHTGSDLRMQLSGFRPDADSPHIEEVCHGHLATMRKRRTIQRWGGRAGRYWPSRRATSSSPIRL
jgi:hypothetical protein